MEMKRRLKSLVWSCSRRANVAILCICLFQAHSLFRLHYYLAQTTPHWPKDPPIADIPQPKTMAPKKKKALVTLSKKQPKAKFILSNTTNSPPMTHTILATGRKGVLAQTTAKNIGSTVFAAAVEMTKGQQQEAGTEEVPTNKFNMTLEDTPTVLHQSAIESNSLLDQEQYGVIEKKANNNGHLRKNNVSIAAELNKIQNSYLKVDQKLEDKNATKVKSLRGVIVLGMHRSGTSLLSGLLVHGLNYKSPGFLINANEQNPYGFYENWNVLRQNDVWLKEQNKTWDVLNVTTSPTNSSIVFHEFSLQQSCSKHPCPKTTSMLERNSKYFFNRNKALHHYNNRTNVPWIMKDPRLCVTLKMWLPLLKGPRPAVVFTFRHPMEVARSLKSRNVNQVELFASGLKLWIWYNRMAIENSRGLCRVVTSNDAIVQNHLKELMRIGNELVGCGLPERSLNITAVDKFFNKEFMHSNTTATAAEESNTKVFHCIIPPFQSELIDLEAKKIEEDIYRKAMIVYCDLQNGNAFQENYSWPILSTIS